MVEPQLPSPCLSPLGFVSVVLFFALVAELLGLELRVLTGLPAT